MPKKTEAIKRFLEIKTHSDLANLYNFNMECQVNVAQDGGERVSNEFKGKLWHGWSDGLTTWKPFRIPYKANTEPEYTDSEIRFDLAEHAEGIGMTGWDWFNLVSSWVAFDFDAIVGHSDKHAKKLTNEELEAVKKAAYEIEWVTIRKSTSGRGLHLYVMLPEMPTKNHHEHSALARAILGIMSARAGFNFENRVDICGGNMWVWHRKMEGTDGLSIIKQGRPILESEIPKNWRDHVKVIKGHKRKNLPQDIEDSDKRDLFDELTGQRPIVKLDEKHRELINYLTKMNMTWWWESDQHMLVTHTYNLKLAYDELNLKGIFDTIAKGREPGDYNCFLFPMRKGAWTVRRFSPGVQEHDSWEQDGAGWTRCYLNREPDLRIAARHFGGLENEKGGFVFREAEQAIKASQMLGVTVNVGPSMMRRETTLFKHKDGRLIVQIKRENSDSIDDVPKFLAQGSKPWTRIYESANQAPDEPEIGNYDDTVRHLVTETEEDYGWVIKSDNVWRYEPLTHVRVALASLGFESKEVIGILGSSVFKAWKLVNKPFQPEYPGDREWNRSAAQLRFTPSNPESELNYVTWTRVLNHCGGGLNLVVKNDGWCRANSIKNGGEYLKIWIASLFQEPTEPLPYLFFFGPQNSGKSIFHEALSLLFTKGYKRADAALVSQAGFNAELEGSILCITEEINLMKNLSAYNRIKDWVTSRELLIHAKNRTPYHVLNTTHWIQCANDHMYCPIFTGDTRITMSFVDALNPVDLIPKKQLIPMLEKEAPDFLASILSLEIPPSHDRLNVPVLTSEDKIIAQQLNQSQLETFMQDKCRYVNGAMVKFSDFYDKFIEWVDANEVHQWTKIRVGRELPPQHPRARVRKTGQMHIGNLTWIGDDKIDETLKKLVIIDGYLELAND